MSDDDDTDVDEAPTIVTEGKRKKPESASKFTNWCWTAFDPNLSEVWLSTIAPSYWCYGVEVCPETSREHWQGYLEVKSATTFNSLKKRSPPGVHWENRKGSQEEAIAYCRKDGRFHEFGTKKALSGQRHDLASVRAAVLLGTSYETIFDDHFGVCLQYGRGIREYSQLKQPHRSWPSEVICIWGPTGTGKSKLANEEGAAFVEYDKSGFIHGYNNESIVCFDDFDPTTMTREVFLRLTDRYHIKVNVKGGSMTWNPRTIYFTSNSNPRDWYNGDEAVRRRMTKIIHTNVNLMVDIAACAANHGLGMDKYDDEKVWPLGTKVTESDEEK